jgi:hypothetical protein
MECHHLSNIDRTVKILKRNSPKARKFPDIKLLMRRYLRGENNNLGRLRVLQAPNILEIAEGK